MKVYDVAGKEVAVLVNEVLAPGIYIYQSAAADQLSFINYQAGYIYTGLNPAGLLRLSG